MARAIRGRAASPGRDPDAGRRFPGDRTHRQYSIPGLAAKPILDILAGAPDAAMLARAIDTLQRADNIYRGDQRIRGRHFFRGGNPRLYHIHLTLTGSDFWRDHLLFRDFLLANPGIAAEYAALKHELAERYRFDRESYIESKTDFVQRVLRAESDSPS